MLFTVKKKEYDIKFAYKPTVKGRLLSRLAELETKEDESVGAIEKILEFIPEILLIGLQKNHADEFGYDYSNGKGKNKAIEAAEDLVEDFVDEGGDVIELYTDLQNELLENGFLAKMFGDEVKKEVQKKSKK